MISDSKAANVNINLRELIFSWNHESDLSKVFIKNYRHFIKHIAELQNVVQKCINDREVMLILH